MFLCRGTFVGLSVRQVSAWNPRLCTRGPWSAGAEALHHSVWRNSPDVVGGVIGVAATLKNKWWSNKTQTGLGGIWRLGFHEPSILNESPIVSQAKHLHTCHLLYASCWEPCMERPFTFSLLEPKISALDRSDQTQICLMSIPCVFCPKQMSSACCFSQIVVSWSSGFLIPLDSWRRDASTPGTLHGNLQFLKAADSDVLILSSRGDSWSSGPWAVLIWASLNRAWWFLVSAPGDTFKVCQQVMMDCLFFFNRLFLAI